MKKRHSREVTESSNNKTKIIFQNVCIWSSRFRRREDWRTIKTTKNREKVYKTSFSRESGIRGLYENEQQEEETASDYDFEPPRRWTAWHSVDLVIFFLILNFFSYALSSAINKFGFLLIHGSGFADLRHKHFISWELRFGFFERFRLAFCEEKYSIHYSA